MTKTIEERLEKLEKAMLEMDRSMRWMAIYTALAITALIVVGIIAAGN